MKVSGGHQSRSELGRSRAVTLVGRLCIDRKSQARIRMTEPRLGRFDVHAFQDHGGGVSSPEIMEAETTEACSFHGGQPHPAAPVRVVEGQSLCVREEQRVRVRASQARGHKVCAERLGELNRNRNRSPPGGGFGRADHSDTTDIPGDLLGDCDGSPQ